MTPSNPSDKRKSRRLDKKVVLRVSTEDRPESAAAAWTIVTSKNISTGGVLFTYDRALDQGTPLRFKIHFPEKTIDCAGTVHRTHPAELRPLVRVAARLEDLGRSDREFIESYPAA